MVAEFEDGHDVVGHRHLAEDRGFLGQVAYAHLRTFVHGVLGELDGLAGLALLRFGCEIDFAGVGFDDADDHVEGGGFAGAVGAEEAYNLTLAHFDGGSFDDGA